MQLLNYQIQALKYCLPYLRQNADIITILKTIGSQYDNLQAAVLYLLNSLNINEARGVWLDYIGAEVGAKRDEYTFGNFFYVNMQHINVHKLFYFLGSGEKPEEPLTLDDATFIQKIFACIGANTTGTTQNQLISIIKTMTNAERVIITRTTPAVLKINLIGNNILFTTNTIKYIQQILGSGIYLEEVTTNGTTN